METEAAVADCSLEHATSLQSLCADVGLHSARRLAAAILLVLRGNTLTAVAVWHACNEQACAFAWDHHL